MPKKPTIFQKLTNILSNSNDIPTAIKKVNSYGIDGSDILFRTRDKDEYENKLFQLKQQKLLAKQWKKANYDLTNKSLAGLNEVKMMYRDCDLMDCFPEIGAALDILMEEANYIPKNGFLVNVTSKSERVKSILQDLLVNRLQINVMLPMVCRSMCKYGNTFMLLDINEENGITNWRQLPVYEIERYENGMENPYANAYVNLNNIDLNQTDSTKFVWVGQTEFTPYRNWQIAHFRLLYDSLFLPYGCLVGDTRIETEYGYKEMSDIQIGDKVWTFNVDSQKRELGEVTMFMPKGEKEVYKVSTKHNFIEGTKDHKILVYDGDKLTYKEIENLKVDDLVVIRNGIKNTGNDVVINKTKIPSSRNRGIKWFDNNIADFPDTVDNELAEFLGYMIGDGSITYGRIITIAGGMQESFNKKYENILRKYTKTKVRRIYRKDGTLLSITASNKFFSEMLYRLGYIDGFDKKRIPCWVFEAPIDIKKSFLRGLINADGYLFIDNRKPNSSIRCDIELANEQLIKDIKILVQSLGYKSGQIFSRQRKPHFSEKIGRIINHRTFSHELSYYEIQNTQEKCNDLPNRLNDGFKLEKIRKIEYVGKKQTYDFTVSNDNSNFFANGIVTHNCSFLQKARRHWKMLSMMEDMMLIYRLERSIERRVFKINVGTIDDADVPAYVEEIANNFKRTPIIDPMTGQLDLKKNILNVSEDFFIPVRDDNASNPIDTLQGAQNMTAMDDIKFIQNKVCTALRIPKSYLNFEETTGDGKNLSLLDVRFMRTVNRVQQALLMELNKICIIHLYLLGFEDELTNFNLTMNNPSSQAEMLELENMAKKVTTAKDAISDAGNGIQLMSWTRACKEIMGWSDKEIEENLQEIRLEKALAAELEKTSQIIKRTRLFDKVDNIYGEPGAEYAEGQPQEGEDGEMSGGGGGGGFGGGAVGSEDFDFGDEGEEAGAEGEMDMNTAAQEAGAELGGGGEEPPAAEEPDNTIGDSYMRNMLKNIINEQRAMQKDIVRKSKKYTNNLIERRKEYENRNRVDENVPIYQKNFLISEDLNNMVKQLSTLND